MNDQKLAAEVKRLNAKVTAQKLLQRFGKGPPQTSDEGVEDLKL
jgi:hypothetical protein